ncbi:tRNA (adenine-N(1))-methyltransferase [Fructobacillus sp. M2-14]|uniref:tRNA (Adenine-N(1))-methyltransferase n=1 Tax=Fructobacillus broussonetiae TaxID=2713173 RepID=A0ABS5R0T2_9LACO|nr:tRNA (adenine(22)-N(1))-methyltransferase TrmK [Fructobacillus broussonetiae]MBS9338221.1 tRNA (adenine-N(1))-methyltransferase [Fructobacillus broussonetiae]
MSQIKLTPRLEAVANLVDDQVKMADIGSDHAYLATYLVEQKKSPEAIVGEVAKGPLNNAKHTVQAQGVSAHIECRLADGLAALTPEDKVQSVVIAGMGGLLIKKILDAKKDLGPFPQLVLQPNTDQDALRAWLIDNGYAIKHEEMVAEGRHRYEIIVARPGAQTLSRADLTFGPVLRKEQGDIFKAKWQHERARYAQVVDRLEQSGQTNLPKYQEVKDWIKAIDEEVFHG